jgi:DNA-binding Lrp family transcriptional regulator
MKELKSLDYKLLIELMKNSKRSDREMARVLGSSQPTITRKRARLEKDFIDGYTVLPKWRNIGFRIVAFTFVKSNIEYIEPEKRKTSLNKLRKWFAEQSNVIVAIQGRGMGWDGIIVSVHTDYLDFAEWTRKHNSECSEFLLEAQSFISDLNPATFVKPLSFKFLEAK